MGVRINAGPSGAVEARGLLEGSSVKGWLGGAAACAGGVWVWYVFL
jgi:hypothetical protein